MLAAFLAFAAYRSGFVRFNYPDEDRYPIVGIDVSHHQDDVDWRTVAADGIDFAFIKATEGGDHRDREFATNWAGTAEARIPRGAYHFFTFCADGGSQSENFLSVVPKPGELPSVADVEFVGNCEMWTSVQAIRGDLQHFLEAVESAHGRRPIIYTTNDARDRILQDRFDAYPLWIRSVFTEPETSAAWTFWQYADNARIKGIHRLVDLNVYAGSRTAFEELVRGSAARTKIRPRS